VYGNSADGGIGGHLHNGGDRMVMYLNDKEICVSKPTYEGETIAGMNDCTKPIKVKKGDAITMKSVYDIKKHPMFVSSSASLTTVLILDQES
jgi:hypothetical protein